ncbi:MAG: pyruvate kinase alpha/beta domain-containing protein [Rhodoferax sp.]
MCFPLWGEQCYPRSGHTSLRAAREHPESPMISLTPSRETADRLARAWEVHSVHIPDVVSVKEMTDVACAIARRERFT